MKRQMQVAEDYDAVEPHPEDGTVDETRAEARAALQRASAELAATDAAQPAVMQLWMARADGFRGELVERCGRCLLPYHPDCAVCNAAGRAA